MDLHHFTDQIEWPNGAGYTPCTPEYAAAIEASQDATAEWHQVRDDPRDPEHAARYEAFCRAEDVVLRLQSQGHQGRGVRYEGAA